jgi:hypothetical protein
MNLGKQLKTAVRRLCGRGSRRESDSVAGPDVIGCGDGARDQEIWCRGHARMPHGVGTERLQPVTDGAVRWRGWSRWWRKLRVVMAVVVRNDRHSAIRIGGVVDVPRAARPQEGEDDEGQRHEA